MPAVDHYGIAELDRSEMLYTCPPPCPVPPLRVTSLGFAETSLKVKREQPPKGRVNPPLTALQRPHSYGCYPNGFGGRRGCAVRRDCRPHPGHGDRDPRRAHGARAVRGRSLDRDRRSAERPVLSIDVACSTYVSKNLANGIGSSPT